jgi:DNA-directed RNA polymerase subunit beta
MSKFALKDNKIQEVDDDEVDYELQSPNAFFGSHANLIPMQSAVQGPRIFYGARFFNQALPIIKAEAPLVQNIDDSDPDGRSFDEVFGRHAGALHADDDYEVMDVTPDELVLRSATGEERRRSLYNAFPFNRKTAITQSPVVAKGDKVPKGKLMAKSNYTDDQGTLALGLNARVGLLPYKGHSMDDAVVISDSFAKRLTSDHAYTLQQDFDHDTKGGMNHFVSLFPTAFNKDQLKTLDEHGVVTPGTIVKNGDPLILATRPKVFSSTSGVIGNLSKAMRQSRADASQTWDEDDDGMVTDVIHNRGNVKVVVAAKVPTRQGDKIVYRSGQKGVISLVLPDDHMPRTADGQPLEVLSNQLGIPSRVNDALPFELMLGKLAKHTGQVQKMPSFTKPGEYWYDIVEKKLQEAGLAPEEEVFDPVENRKLERPITVGNGYILKLHHTAASKTSSRSQGGYDSSGQPLKGGGASAQAKRLSGLEIHSMMSAGAYKNLREGATLRGASNDEYWRALRQGYRPKEPGVPLVWDKFQALLQGSGLHARSIDKQRMRLGPFTDRDLGSRKAMEIQNPELVNLATLEPVKGGLFDESITGTNSWGKISMPHPFPNPAFEPAIRQLLGLTEKQMREIIAGRAELPEELR